MTELGALLRHAAGPPPRGDFAEAQRRAASRRKRWWASWAAAATAVGIGLSVPTTSMLSPAGDDGRADPDRGAEAAGPVDAGADPSATAVGAARPPASTPGVSPPPSRQPAASAHGGTIDSPPALARGCELDSQGAGVSAGVASIGTDDPWADSCTFTAAEDGGYVASAPGGGHWRIEIRRGGTTIVVASGVDPDCGPVGVVKRGDEVVVSVRTASVATGGYVKVGPAWHCRESDGGSTA